MTSYTVNKVSGVCKAINVDTGQVVVSEGGTVVVGSDTYTTLKRPTDQVCCIYRIDEGVGGDPDTLVQVCEEGQTIQA